MLQSSKFKKNVVLGPWILSAVNTMTKEDFHHKLNRNDRKVIAIKDDNGKRQSPVITAKGTGNFAEKLLDIAFENDVKVRRDKALTEILSAYEIDSPVPMEALNAVSLILDYVYKENLRQQRIRQRDTSDDTISVSEKDDIIDI